jgi:hypothetical protein
MKVKVFNYKLKKRYFVVKNLLYLKLKTSLLLNIENQTLYIIIIKTL